MAPARLRIFEILESQEFPAGFKELFSFPVSQLTQALFSAICRPDGLLKWHGVSAMGRLVVRMAGRDVESARVIMRRLLWSLTEESGGIGWGAPEALAECMACHPLLEEEYGHILVSFLRKDGNFLEFEPLQRGVLWGVGRLADAYQDVFQYVEMSPLLLPHFHSSDAGVRGHAVRAAGLAELTALREDVAALREDVAPVMVYDNFQCINTTVSALAEEALKRL